MNNFELFKLKQAGLTNLQIINILDYQKEVGKSLSLRDMAVVSQTSKAGHFMESYKHLDLKYLRQQFNQFPSLSILDKEYPENLAQIYNPPVLLFYQGDLTLLDAPKLSIVGSRDCTNLGTKSVQKIVRELANHFVIVSGLARGIDTGAHIACLKNGGKSIAVIGTGLDIFYPKENHDLQEYLAKHHLVLTEYEPGQQPLKFHFPERNRIIAGLSQGTVVVEAKQRSGSLITCERAMEEGRDVFAVPGNILDGRSDGCHHLIQEGAKCIMTGLDILEEFD
ncbi:DNA-processing protein DprA [Streptococcus tangpeifui]|uniref:DNA-processing protein DprA n=1 Tax=Streptococcus tangpeifui TaxID=2709400 RepID=UPI0013EE38E4|nr:MULTISPECIES: DNA-processing protein DprA [unclassified Streptococcus]